MVALCDPCLTRLTRPTFTDLDRRTNVAAVKAARSIAMSPAMGSIMKREVKPGQNAAVDLAVLQLFRNKGAAVESSRTSAWLDRYGRRTVAIASSGLAGDKRRFEMKREPKTPEYTTRWLDMPTAPEPSCRRGPS